ncbi:MAG: hypothetical protein AB1Z57_00310 [Acidimicrobiia bacterium]
MRRSALLLATAVVVAACGSGPVATTTSSTTTTTTAPPVTTTAAPVEPIPFAALAIDTAAVTGLPDGPSLTAGFGRRLGIAHDDLAGGIVYEELADEVWQVWLLEAGRRDPVAIGVPGARLGDVDFLADRPVTAVLWTDDALLLQTVKGGAPDVLVRSDLALPDDPISGISIGGSLLGVATVADECHDVTILSSGGDPVGEPFGLCAAVPPRLTPDGSLVVHLEVGASTRVVFVDTGTGEEVARHQVPTGVVGFTADVGAAVVAVPDAVLRVSVAGTTERLDWDPVGNPVVATALRAPLVVSDLASLGGTEFPTDCSARELAAPEPVSGLSPAADRTRTVIIGAARNCDFYGLATVPSGNFSGPVDLADTLIRAELDGIPLMADLVRTLELPFATETATSGASFIWPSVAGIDTEVGDADWEALEALYNEERIEEWRSGRAPFDGMSVWITEDGQWIGLGGVAPDG